MALVLVACLLFTAPARAWDAAVYDKLSIGQTTPGEAEALLGRPYNIRRLLFDRKDERWSYTTRGGLGESLRLDFIDGRLSRKLRLPDAVEDRPGLVMEFGVGPSSIKTTGTHPRSGAETGLSLGIGWALSSRLALLFEVAGSAGRNSGLGGGGPGIRIFPVMPWYLQADALSQLNETVHAPPAQDYTVYGNGYDLRTGYELGFFRHMAISPELFLIKAHVWGLDSTAPVGAAEDLRNTIWGFLLKLVWYP